MSEPHWPTVLALCEALETTPNAFAEKPAKRPPAKRGRPTKGKA